MTTNLITAASPHRLLRFILVPALLLAGFWLRSLPAMKAGSGVSGWWPWTGSRQVTVYFFDGPFLFPLTRRIAVQSDVPRAVLQALLAGPSAVSGLRSPFPHGTELRSFKLANGLAQIDLSVADLGERGLTHEAEEVIVETLTALPGVNSVELGLEGKPLTGPAKRTPLLYYASANGIAAVPVADTTPRAALDTYLAGPPDPRLSGLPPDVRLLKYEYDAATGLVSVDFSYTPSARALALDHPERVRFVLLGLIASLTEFAGVQAVRIDFEGRTRLGLGQCSDLLRVPQPRPELLNDERLLGR